MPDVNTDETVDVRKRDAPRSNGHEGASIGWIVLVLVGGAITLTFAAYFLFILFDTGDGSYSRNVSRSMAPAILAGDYVTARHIGERMNGDGVIQRGDLVVHAWPPDPSKQFMTRVVGLPGDTLAMTDGTLSVNGRAIREAYAHRDEPTIDPAVDDFNWQRRYVVGQAANDTSKYVASRNNWGPLVVPRGAIRCAWRHAGQSLLGLPTARGHPRSCASHLFFA
jgi:signal peptidase I